MNKYMPIQDRIDKINKLYDEGHTIVYLTARGMGRYNNNADLAKKEFYEFTEIQLSLWGCKYHQLFLGKPSADYYIDDKGYIPMNSSEAIKHVPKGWGYEKWIVNTEDYCGKLLYFEEGKRCSFHYHKSKDETFYLQSGKILLYYGDTDNLNEQRYYFRTGR